MALARAFAPNPQLVSADEPTGNLDAATGQQVIDLMFDLNAKQGTTAAGHLNEHEAIKLPVAGAFCAFSPGGGWL
ncbi:MAG: hypothetical protein IPJ12_12555 [Betaproteobacteria bacterium]|nr:hypothetical protein [Betaproteobacteria bacterium]